MTDRQYLTREQIRLVKCPKCGADPGVLCRNSTGAKKKRKRGAPREPNHHQRQQLAQRTVPRSQWTTQQEPLASPGHQALDAEFHGTIFR